MTTVPLKFGIPDICLSCGAGETINPSTFAGHELIVVFCPTDLEEGAEEIDAYRKHAAEFVACDAWILGIGDQCGPTTSGQAGKPLLISDPDRHAWVAFRNLTHSPETLDRADGATFLFTRGGGLHRYWHGSGHVHEVLEELRSPLTERRDRPRRDPQEAPSQ
jgi:peroxiredoxin